MGKRGLRLPRCPDSELLAPKLGLAASCWFARCVGARRESGAWQQWDFPAPRASPVPTGKRVPSPSPISPAAVPCSASLPHPVPAGWQLRVHPGSIIS